MGATALGGIDGNSDDAVSAAANKLRGHHFSPDWPWGSEALSETVLDDNTKLGQWRDCCVPHKEIAGPVAHIDTTLLCNAIGVLNGKLPATPITVLDLASLINTICVYDKICYLESRNVERSDVEQLLGKDVFVELPVASTAFEGSDYEMLNDISQPLRNLYKHRTVRGSTTCAPRSLGPNDNERHGSSRGKPS